jgi:hypothetical protein
MTDHLQTLLTHTPLEEGLFAPNSRYHGIALAVREDGSSRSTAYLRRRFVPSPNRYRTLQEHTVVQGDRLDNLAHHYFGDTELFWKLCDANGAIRPDELTGTIGRKLRIALPEGA